MWIENSIMCIKEYNIRKVLEEIVCRMWIDSSGSELGPVADCYEHGNETSGSIKYDVFQYFLWQIIRRILFPVNFNSCPSLGVKGQL
jgi:hypothetical protein